ncbi:MAG: AraC family transcriptional regulator [Prolixibacteraceae bacterium]|jgi:AraC-like DNA-binding protein|nr:AraC family transcriptional regulator [Prolixibacteraceae bacterium]
MKVSKIRLLQEPNKSFIVFKETNAFSRWHHHPEYELVLITKGKGRRMVGDHIDRFNENDLVLLGPYTPHEWMCDPEYFEPDGHFLGEGIVIQFLPDFLGDQFFEVQENAALNKILGESSRAIEILGDNKEKIIEIVKNMIDMDGTDRLYSLLSIFKILSSLEDFNILASTAFINQFKPDENTPMQKAMQYIVQNFQHQIYLNDLLANINMSYSSFNTLFKITYRMTFKEYLLNIRIGYACKLLTGALHNISETAYLCGFENISNFNRQFKNIKGITPSEFHKQVHEKRSAIYQ